MAYRFGLLRIDVSAEADKYNSKLLGEKTLGIEITSDFFSNQCGLGNIDPQHQEQSTSSAIEEALIFPLPENGSTLVTIRLDKDSIGAMAVLDLRREKKESLIDKMLITWIGVMDRVGSLEANKDFIQLSRFFQNSKEIPALNVIAHDTSIWPTLESKVEVTKKILCRELSLNEIEAISKTRGPAIGSFEVEMCGGVAFIESPGMYDAARAYGNKNFPVAVIFDPSYESEAGGKCRRFSVVRQKDVFDRRGFELAINLLEANNRDLTLSELKAKGLAWGGPSNIVSSQNGEGRDTILAKETVIECVKKYLENKIVT